MKYTNGFATVIQNMFAGSKKHELTICVESGLLGDIRRLAVANSAEAIKKCAELNVRPQFLRNF